MSWGFANDRDHEPRPSLEADLKVIEEADNLLGEHIITTVPLSGRRAVRPRPIHPETRTIEAVDASVGLDRSRITRPSSSDARSPAGPGTGSSTWLMCHLPR